MLRLLLLLKRKNGLKQGGCSDGDDNDDVDDVGQIEFIALSTGCMSMMMKVTATFDRRTRLHIEHLQEREQDAQFSKPQSKDHAKERRNVGQQSQSSGTPATFCEASTEATSEAS